MGNVELHHSKKVSDKYLNPILLMQNSNKCLDNVSNLF